MRAARVRRICVVFAMTEVWPGQTLRSTISPVFNPFAAMREAKVIETSAGTKGVFLYPRRSRVEQRMFHGLPARAS